MVGVSAASIEWSKCCSQLLVLRYMPASSAVSVSRKGAMRSHQVAWLVRSRIPIRWESLKLLVMSDVFFFGFEWYCQWCETLRRTIRAQMSYSSCSWHWLCKIALVPWCVRLSCKEKGHLVQRNSGADSAAGKSVTTTNGHSGSHALSQVPSLSTQRVRCSSLNDDCSCGGSALPSPRPDPDKAPFVELAYQPVTHPSSR